MKITLNNSSAAHTILSYREGGLRINEQDYGRSLVVTAERIVPDWRPQSVEELTAEDFDAILELEPGLVILGTGGKLSFPPPSLYAGLIRQGIGLEIMDTPAACRTYNILMAEGRSIAAALIMI